MEGPLSFDRNFRMGGNFRFGIPRRAYRTPPPVLDTMKLTPERVPLST
jgi:hypothetical protein